MYQDSCWYYTKRIIVCMLSLANAPLQYWYFSLSG